MKASRLVMILPLAAFLLASAASVFLAFVPIYESISMNSSTQEITKSSATLIQVNGYRVLIPLAIPPIITAINLLAILRFRRGSRPLMWTMTALLMIFVTVSGFSIGLFYAPAALTMIIAALFTLLTASKSSRNSTQE